MHFCAYDINLINLKILWLYIIQFFRRKTYWIYLFLKIHLLMFTEYSELVGHSPCIGRSATQLLPVLENPAGQLPVTKAMIAITNATIKINFMM